MRLNLDVTVDCHSYDMSQVYSSNVTIDYFRAYLFLT